MGIPRQARWLLVTFLVMGGLVGISLLALDRENVVWVDYKPHCPFCRSDVKWYATRCPACARDFDWVYASDEDSPICTHCLAPGEDEHVRERRKVLGEEAAAKRVAAALDLTTEAAAAYLRGLARGECGWCGGSGKDLAAKPGSSDPCPVCFGGKKCIVCGGDRRVHIGQEGANSFILRYEALVASLGTEIRAPVERQREELRRENERFTSRYSGTSEAVRLLFWPRFPAANGPPLPAVEPEDHVNLRAGRDSGFAAFEARRRVVRVLQALVAE